MAGPGPWEEGGRGKVNLPECSNTPDRVGGLHALGMDFMAIGRKNSRSKINLFDACRICCFFASSFLDQMLKASRGPTPLGL